MKKNFLLLFALVALFFASCSDSDNPIDKDKTKNEIENSLLILSQGSFNGNNSSLALYNFDNDELDDDFFNTTNERGLGDTGNDMIRHGDKIYIVVNASSTVEVISALNGKSLKQINFKNDAGIASQPRFAVAHADKVYVTSFDNTVSRIDTTSLSVDAIIEVGRNPEGIVATNNKLYVANSGGLDFGNPDNTVSVIDIATFKEEKKIEVDENPFLIYADSQGDIYVTTRDVYDADFNWVAGSSLQRIKANSHEVETIEGINPSGEFTIVNDKAYIVINDYVDTQVAVYDCISEKLITENFITDGTSFGAPFSVSVDTASGDLFLTETDYTTPGNVYCFGKDGKQKYKLEAVGISPYVVQHIR